MAARRGGTGAEPRREGEQGGVEQLNVSRLGEDVDEARGGGGGVCKAMDDGEVLEEAVHGSPGEQEPRGGLEEELAEVVNYGGERQRGEAPA
ncbi:hypothetical protein E2562_015690 [Oryza meyeriana var. granulata]|uniref:DUF834 domain-containing protein n=1 Tax=Oryza meyeriana var. granulata TaxID=110450 RepID=A0A6G1D399_9ORYZ|nr:hypothetical protein E2562_015690 [Oryza meyeriana var. granulata]